MIRTHGRLLRTLLLLALIGAAGAGVLGSGLVEHLSDQERLRAVVQRAGLLAPLLFVALMVLLVPMNVPGVLFVIPSTALFGLVGGIALSLVGGFLASAVGVVAARRLGRTALERRLPPVVRRLEGRLAAHGFWTVAGLRAVTFLTQPVDWLCGISSIPMRTVLGGTFVGLVPPTVVVAVAGGGLLELLP